VGFTRARYSTNISNAFFKLRETIGLPVMRKRDDTVLIPIPLISCPPPSATLGKCQSSVISVGVTTSYDVIFASVAIILVKIAHEISNHKHLSEDIFMTNQLTRQWNYHV
jgi:hypothetical protein